MYKAMFQNSKAALLFAAVIIVSAIVMVGSPEDKGMLNKAVDRFGEQPEAVAEAPQEYTEPPVVESEKPAIDPAAGWGSSKASPFGDYNGDAAAEGDFYEAAPQPAATAPKSAPQARIPGPQPVIADSEGIPVPGLDDD
jgi:hypothetical protein